MMDWNGNAGWGNGGMLMMGLFFLVLIALSVWAVLRLSHRSGDTRPADVESARHILDRRFAAGDIDAQAYAESRHILEGRSVDFVKGHGA